MIDFGPWLPDHPSLGHPGVLTLSNAFPAIRGYRSVRSPSPSTESVVKISAYDDGGTVPASEQPLGKVKGIFSTVDVNSGQLETQVFVGTESALYKIDATDNKFTEFNYHATTPQTNPSYSSITRWRFAEFATTGGARYVYAAGGAGQLLQRFDSNGSSAPADVAGAPNATHLAVVGRFLVCANTAASEAQVVWSQIDDATAWTEGTNQAGSQVLADVSEITGLVGGETGLILSRDGIYRMEYVGDPLVFTFDKVSNRGCDFPGSVASLSSDDVFYLSEDGFHRYKQGQVISIGAERVNDFFFAEFDRTKEADLVCVVDPSRDLVIWSYASLDGGGTNSRLLAYNYVLDNWGIATISHDHIGLSRQLGQTLEQLDTENPDIDAMTVTLDSGRFSGGPAILSLAVTGASGAALNGLDGPTLPLTLTTGEFEPAEKRSVLARALLPHIEASDATVTGAIGGRARQVDSLAFNAAAEVNPENIIPCRLSARYFAARFTATGEWQQAFGFSLDAVAQGRR